MDSHSFFDLSATSLFRPPDWRWRRAEWRLGRPRAKHLEPDDEMTKRLVQYRRKAAALAKRSRGCVPRGFDDIAAAVDLRLAGGPRALELEARILAQQPLTEIADVLNVTFDTIVAYEATFFCVLDRLQARDWILAHAIYGSRRGDSLPSNAAMLLRYLAFIGGVHALEVVLPELINGFQPDAAPADLSTPESKQRQMVRVLLQTVLCPTQTRWELPVVNCLQRDLDSQEGLDQEIATRTKSVEVLQRHLACWTPSEVTDTAAKTELASATGHNCKKKLV